MAVVRFVIKPKSFFHTPMKGDTLFGQLCWALRHRLGEPALTELLTGYMQGNPFLVISDAFPSGFLPRPCVPAPQLGFNVNDPIARKQAKGRIWLPKQYLSLPLNQWADKLVAASEVITASEVIAASGLAEFSGRYQLQQVRTHNSLNRLTFTTGSSGGFAPFDRTEHWLHPAAELDLWAWCDQRLSTDQLAEVLSDVGATGFGKEASAGAGKFDLKEWGPEPVDTSLSQHYLTLSPCAPQGLSWHSDQCFYQTFVRFGRHGDQAVHLGNPYKNPVMLADTGALLSPVTALQAPVLGQGVGGVSKVMDATVHQGYSLALPVSLC